jgi:hypothetical protein
VAARQLAEALTELNALLARKAAARGCGFADSFPTAKLSALLKARLARASLSKADWVALGSVRT